MRSEMKKMRNTHKDQEILLVNDLSNENKSAIQIREPSGQS
jgi:hypothetical protein